MLAKSIKIALEMNASKEYSLVMHIRILVAMVDYVVMAAAMETYDFSKQEKHLTHVTLEQSQW